MDQTIKLDTRKRVSEVQIAPLRRGERNNVTLTVAVRRDRRPYDLTDMTAHLVWQAADGKLVGPVPMEVTDQAAGTVRCTLPDACYAAVGMARAYIELRRGAELVDTTDEILINVLDCIDADAEQAEEYKPLIAEVRDAIDAAIEAAARADAINVIAPKTVDTAQAASTAFKYSLAIGAGAKCEDNKSAQLAVGLQSDAVGDKSVAVGIVSKASGDFSTSIGLYASSDGKYSTAEGVASNSFDEHTTAIGAFAQSVKAAATAIGANTAAVGNYSTAIGVDSSTCSSRCVAIGMNAAVNGPKVPDPNVLEFSPSGTDSVVLGSFSVADDYRTVSVGNDVDGIDHYYRATDNDGHPTTVAPFWAKKTVELPARYRHIKRRIIHVAEPIDGHNAATKHYVDTNTSNALVGTAKDTLAHVDDAFAGAALRKITVEGAVKQDGIPSPDAPKPITVIEHPAVKVVGRNLWPFASSCTSSLGHENRFVNDKTPLTILPGTYTFSAVGSLGNTDAPLFGYTATGKRIQLFRILRNVQNPKYSFTVTEPITSVFFVSNAADTKNGTISNIQLEHDSAATEYAPYTSQTLAFALPAEHPYLAKLPDGTADEIVVDQDGNVELVARVSKVLPKDNDRLDFGAGTDTDAPYVSFPAIGIASKTGILSNGYQTSDWTNKSGYIYCPTGIDIAIRDSRFTSKEKAIELLDGVVVYIAMEPTRYSLGKIEMPKAQDSIVNVWTDAEVTPNTGIEYVRDVNIVVANIESAIASITEG